MRIHGQWVEQEDEAAVEEQQRPAAAGGRRSAARAPVLRRIGAHDRYQLELKLGYPLTAGEETRYLIDTYIFLPASLDINSSTYGPTEFYHDIQTYIRMKTPRLLLEQILKEPTSPLCRSERLLAQHSAALGPDEQERVRDSFRILRAVLKSALKRQLALLHYTPERAGRYPGLFLQKTETLLSQSDELAERYRSLEAALGAAVGGDALHTSYRLADEAISVLIEDFLLQLHELGEQWLQGSSRMAFQQDVRRRMEAELDYRRRRRYPSALSEEDGEALLHRLSALKKFTSSVLWLSTTTRREGSTWEQVLFASAAGVSMIFATMVAFFAQSIYGQISLPVFVALVVGYMFKDRIKESGRSLSARLLSRQLYNYRTTIETQDGRRKLGYVREKMVHVSAQSVEKRLPPAVLAARASDPAYEPELLGAPESIIHYAKQVTLRKDAFAYLSGDGLEISAINDITRLDVRTFLRKMDDPYETRPMLRGGRVVRVRCPRTYPVHLISVFAAEDGTTLCERTRLVLNRNGIVRLEQFDAGR